MKPFMYKVIGSVLGITFVASVNALPEKEFAESKAYAQQLVASMDLEQKVSMLAGMGTSRSEFGDRDVPYFGVKGIPEKGIPDLIMGHGITGVRTGRDTQVHSTYFGSPMAIGSSWDVELYARQGEIVAKEMRALGQDLNLGPTINIIRHPLGGRNWESFSEDPYLTSRFIVPYVKAMQSNGIIAGPKHFVANNQEAQRFDINNVVDERTLREIYLPGFRAAVIEGHALNIMSAYNRLNGEFMSQNAYLLTDILRKEWGFKGFVLSDFSRGLRDTVGGVKAGMNIEMAGPKFYGDELLKALKRGDVSERETDQLLIEVLTVMHWIGIFERPRVENPEIVHQASHIDLAREVTESSVVLLKNEDAILPLRDKSGQSIAILGPNAKRFKTLAKDARHFAYYLQGGGSGRTYYYVDSVISPYQGMQNVFSKSSLKYAQGSLTPDLYANNNIDVDQQENDRLLAKAVAVAKSSDQAIIFAGLSGFNESEGWDRQTARLPAEQEKLIKAVTEVNKNTVVVLISGTYINVSHWIDKVKALLFAPYSGEQIGNGLANILAGDVSPSGKLSISWPKTEEDYPRDGIYRGEGYSKAGTSNIYKEGIYVGYRWFDKQNIELLYPFGFGLSYSSFKYSDAKIKNEDWPYTVDVQVTNTGKYAAKEVIQLYVGRTKSSLSTAKIDTAPQQLKGFTKIALQAGESKTVSFRLHHQDFAYYDAARKQWSVEAGDYQIKLASHSRDKLAPTVVLKISGK